MTDHANHNHTHTQEATMLDNETRPPARDTDRTHTRRLFAGLTLVIVGSFGFGAWTCATVADHDARHEATYRRAVTRALDGGEHHPTARLREDLAAACKAGVSWSCVVDSVGIKKGEPGNLIVSVDSAGHDNDGIAGRILDHAPAGFDRVTIVGPDGAELATANAGQVN